MSTGRTSAPFKIAVQQKRHVPARRASMLQRGRASAPLIPRRANSANWGKFPMVSTKFLRAWLGVLCSVSECCASPSATHHYGLAWPPRAPRRPGLWGAAPRHRGPGDLVAAATADPHGLSLGPQAAKYAHACREHIKRLYLRCDAPRIIDSVLAASGLAGCIAAMAFVEAQFGAKVFITSMLSSGITFFAPMTPPSPYGFLVGTAGAATICAATLNAVKSRLTPFASASPAATGAMRTCAAPALCHVPSQTGGLTCKCVCMYEFVT
jgi:hypothetical protein